MKRFSILLGLLAVLCFASVSLAASSIDTSLAYDSQNLKVLRLKCVSHTDGSFTASTLISGAAWEYWSGGWVIAHAYAVNGASGNPDTAGTVTITDALGQQLIGSTAGDTLTLSTSASGVALLVIDRASKQRAVTAKLYATIGDTQSGSATSYFDIYIVFSR